MFTKSIMSIKNKENIVYIEKKKIKSFLTLVIYGGI